MTCKNPIKPNRGYLQRYFTDYKLVLLTYISVPAWLKLMEMML